MELTGAEAIVKLLQEEKVNTIFGYPGGQVIPLYDALYDSDFRNVLTVHEQGAIHAADGYARASGRVGVCLTTSGPGATNIVTGMATAYLDSVPLVVLTGQVPLSHLGRDSFQEVDIISITKAITKYNTLVEKPEDLLPTLRKAFHLAREGRPGPVLIDIPSCIQKSTLTWSEASQAFSVPSSTQVSPENLLKASELLSQAQRPVLLVGGGAVLAEATEELKDLAHKTGLPVVTTLMGIGSFPSEDCQSLGLTGMHGHFAANMAIAQADLLLVAGSRFNERVTGDRDRYAGEKTIIHLDIDPAEVDKNISATLPLVGHLKTTLQELLPLINTLSLHPWWEKIKAWQSQEEQKDTGELTAPWIMRTLNSYYPQENTIYVTDVGQNQMWAAQHLAISRPRQFLTSGGCGTMGFGLPAALGAKLAQPHCQVVSIAGDGGFKMTGMELHTAVKERLPFLSLVLNNSCLGMVRQWQQVFYNERYSSSLLAPFDFLGFARAAGAEGLQVKTQEEFLAALDKAAEAQLLGKSFLLEAIIPKEDLVLPMVAPGAKIDDFVTPKKCR